MQDFFLDLQAEFTQKVSEAPLFAGSLGAGWAALLLFAGYLFIQSRRKQER